MRGMSRGPGGSITVSHREFFTDALGSTIYNLQSFFANPGNSSIFPWLSTIAVNFSKFRFRSLIFEYEPMASTSTTGTVGLAFDPNSYDSIPPGKAAFYSFANSVRSAPWQAVSLSVALGNMRQPPGGFFVWNGTGAPPNERLEYLTGQFMYLTDQQSATGIAVGEIYVRYVIDLYQPLQAGVTASGSGSLGSGQLSLNAVTPTNTQPFGSTPVAFALPAIFASSFTILPSQINFNDTGYWLITLNYSGTGLASYALSGSTASITYNQGIQNTGNTQGQQTIIVDVTVFGQTLVLSEGFTTTTAVLLRIVPWDSLLS
jgi:hypothetical protein